MLLVLVVVVLMEVTATAAPVAFHGCSAARQLCWVLLVVWLLPARRLHNATRCA